MSPYILQRGPKSNEICLYYFIVFRIYILNVLHALSTKTVKDFLQEDEHDMDVDTATSGTQIVAKHSLPELEIYCYLLVLIFLIDQKRYNEVT